MQAVGWGSSIQGWSLLHGPAPKLQCRAALTPLILPLVLHTDSQLPSLTAGGGSSLLLISCQAAWAYPRRFENLVKTSSFSDQRVLGGSEEDEGCGS